jgi:hypothetical protein
LRRNPTELEEIRENLERLNEKIDMMLENQKKFRIDTMPIKPDSLDIFQFLSLPDHLRRSFVAISRLEEATADEVAEQTKRARAVESSYLNQLVTMGYLKKMRKSRKVYFITENGA